MGKGGKGDVDPFEVNLVGQQIQQKEELKEDEHYLFFSPD